MGPKRKAEDMTKARGDRDAAMKKKSRVRRSGENDGGEPTRGSKRGSQAGDQSVTKKSASQSRAQKDRTAKRKTRKNPNFELIQVEMRVGRSANAVCVQVLSILQGSKEKSRSQSGLGRSCAKRRRKTTRRRGERNGTRVGVDFRVQQSMIAVGVDASRLAKEIISKARGKAALLCSSHKFSRVLQSCLKHCDDAEKIAILDELRPAVLTLAKDTYAHHLVRLLFEIGIPRDGSADMNTLILLF